VCMLSSLPVFLSVLHMLRVLCSVLYYSPPFCFLSSFSTHLIDTFVTVPIDVRITLLMCLNSVFICIFIFLIPAYVNLNMYTHFPSLQYSYTLISIFICMFCVLFYIHSHLSVFFFCSTNLIDTYVTVPIDVRITLLICLDSFFKCLFISLTPAYIYLSLYTHSPSSSINVHLYPYVHVHALCNGLYCYMLDPAHMSVLLFYLNIFYSNTCICVSKHIYAFPCSSIFVHMYRHFHMYCLFYVLHLYSCFCLHSSFSET